MNRVFVSYSRRNRTFAERLARDLSDAGLDVWIDFRQIHGGEMWEQEIYRGIERSEIVVLCLSPAAVASEWVQREVLTAREQKKFIIPVMVQDSFQALQETPSLNWLMRVQYLDFTGDYEQAFPDLLRALPGRRRIGAYDSVDAKNVTNPFKGLEAFQQTDAAFFFGRDRFIKKAVQRLEQNRATRFLAVVGASGSGKSSLVRAGVLPALRTGALSGSETWRIMIMTPGSNPISALANRMAPLIEDQEAEAIDVLLHQSVSAFSTLVDAALAEAPPEAQLLLMVDQFEEVFTRASEAEAERFLSIVNRAATEANGRAIVLITMRADFFDRLSRYPVLAELFEQENLVIVTEMSAAELLQTIEGPAQAVGLIYDQGLPQRILEEVRRQPGSLPLLQYALKELFKRRDGLRLTIAAYEEIGGVQQALAQHAEDIYQQMGAAEQAIMKRVMLRLIEVSESGEATRRRVDREELTFRDVPDNAVQELIDRMTASDTRLLIASRQIMSNTSAKPVTTVEVSHEALIREWDRFQGWVTDNVERLRTGSELLQAANNWKASDYDRAYLLTGNRLRRAEVWLDEADATPLQRDFVQVSLEEDERRQEQRRIQVERELMLQRRAASRLRLIVGVLVIGFAAAIGLTLFALDAQARAEQATIQAEAREAEAVEQRSRALSLALSVGSSRALDDLDGDLAAMLAVYANQLEDPPPQSERTLADVVFFPGTRRLFNAEGVALEVGAISPDGTTAFIAEGSDVLLWDVLSGQQIDGLGFLSGVGHGEPVRALALSVGGSLIATGGEDNRIIVWDAETRQALGWLDGHQAAVTALAFHPDGSALISGDATGTLIQWDLASQTAVATFSEAHSTPLNAIAFNQDGDVFASAAADDPAITVWRYTSRGAASLRQLTGGTDDTGHSATVNALAFEPADKSSFLLSGGADNVAVLWNFENAREVHRFTDHRASVTAVGYSPDAATLYTADADGVLRLWDAASRDAGPAFDNHNDAISALTSSADGRLLMTTSLDGTSRVWDVGDAALVRAFSGHETSAILTDVVGVFGPAGDTVLSGGADGTLRLWETQSALTVQAMTGGHSSSVNAVDISPDGTLAVSGGGEGRVVLWDIASGASLWTGEAHPAAVFAARFSADGRFVVTGDADGGLIRWDAATGEVQATYGPSVGKDGVGHSGPVYGLALSPDGLYLFSAAADQNLILWDVAAGTVVNSFKGHNDAVNSVAFNADGTRALSGGANGTLILWDMDAAKAGAALADVLIFRLSGHEEAVTAVDFSLASAHFVSAALDGTLRLWDLETGSEVRRFVTDAAPLISVDVSPDSQHILTGTADGDLLLWRALPRPDDMLAFMASNRFVREPSCQERAQFEIEPLCVENQPVATATPVPLPTATPAPVVGLRAGSQAVVNVVGGDSLTLRAQPGLNGSRIAAMPDGSIVTVLEDTPAVVDGLVWWPVQTADGQTGWAVETLPDLSVRSLVPVGALAYPAG